MHTALDAIRNATEGTPFEADLWIVGGAVRDEMLGIPHLNDFDLVTRGSSADLAHLLHQKGVSSIPPVTYERFGTALVRVGGVNIELVTARRESYEPGSRKPTVQPATYEEDALRRDITVNTLMRNLRTGELRDPLGVGLNDLEHRVIRTPLDPMETFRDDPLRILRTVRFRWKLGFQPVDGLYPAVRVSAPWLKIISHERIRDEFAKMLRHPSAPNAMSDLMDLGLFAEFIPEFLPMVGCEQGSYHHLDVWDHSMLVLDHVGPNDLVLSLSALFHDIGKPSTRHVDGQGATRFFGHEAVGAKLTGEVLRRLRFPQDDINPVVALVKNHMRLGSAKTFTPSAARRVLRDLGDQTDRLLDLVDADSRALRPGVRALDLETFRNQIYKVKDATPTHTLQSPLTGEEIMRIASIGPGPVIGRFKSALNELVLDGMLAPDDREGAIQALQAMLYASGRSPRVHSPSSKPNPEGKS